MTAPLLHHETPPGSAATAPSPSTADELLQRIKDRWGAGEPADARQILENFPELRQRKSLALDLIYEEYCRQVEATGPIDAAQFTRRYPTYRASLERLIEVHDFFEQNKHLLVADTNWPRPGAPFREFDVLEELGHGALGRAYLVRQRTVGNRLAVIKVAREGGHEADTLGRLQHANIVPIHGVKYDESNGESILIMPFLGRATLLDVLDELYAPGRTPRSGKEILDVAQAAGAGVDDVTVGPPDSFLFRRTYVDGVIHLGVQLAEALASAHARGIFHLDLKPSNVLLTPAGRPRLLDFNLSRDERAHSQRLGGTVAYMSPEQVRATLMAERTGPLGASSDVFSLAVLLFELLAGRLPFDVGARKHSPEILGARLLAQHQRGPHDLSTLRPEARGPLAQLLARCLSVDLGERPPSMESLAGELKGLLRPRHRLGRWTARHSWAPRLACAAVLFAVAGFATFAMTRDPAEIRDLARGQNLLAAGDYTGAITCLNRALERSPAMADALLARAAARQHAGQYAEAIDDYIAAERLTRSPRVAVGKAYCFARLSYYPEAIACYRQLIEQGSGSASVYNNLATMLVTMGQRVEARWWSSAAIEADPTLQSAYVTRARCDSSRSMSEPGYVPEAGLKDIARAIELGPVSRNLYCEAAMIGVAATQVDDRWKSLTVEYLKQAVDHGFRPHKTFNDSFWRVLGNDVMSNEIMTRTPGYQSPGTLDLLIEPF